MSVSVDFLQGCVKGFQEVTNKTTDFLQADENFCNEIKKNLKLLYDFTKGEEQNSRKSMVLPKLITDNFDVEQIWQQIELQNESVIAPSLTTVSRLIVSQTKLTQMVQEKQEPNDTQNENGTQELEESPGVADSEDEDLDDVHSSGEDESVKSDPPKKNKRGSVVDDEFFKLTEMEKFLQAEEKNVDNSDSGNDFNDDELSVDLFEESSNDSSKMETAKYKDFFVPQEVEKKKSRNKHLTEIEEDNIQSSHELKQNRLSQKIQEIEEGALEDKSWQLKGEITATNRPQNSLLEEIVEFDLTSRPAPVITEQTTMQLEDVIKERIKNQVFDSVERKVKPTETFLDYKKKLVLDQEKSKESLAQIYEKEYLQQQANLTKDDEREEKIPELHQEINTLMNSLFTKLDALSNFHFSPKPAIPELKIISNLPAITMEEVAPVVTSDAALLAPQEIKTANKGDIMGKAERTSTDKKRERRKKKLKQKTHKNHIQKEQSSTTNSGSNKKFSNSKTKNGTKVSSDVKTLKSSKAFFTQLEEVNSSIKRKLDDKPSKKSGSTQTAKKLKL